jgi:hypothetical protein
MPDYLNNLSDRYLSAYSAFMIVYCLPNTFDMGGTEQYVQTGEQLVLNSQQLPPSYFCAYVYVL